MRRGFLRGIGLALLVALLGAPVAGAAQAAPGVDPGITTGMPLAEALRQLEADGIRLIWSDVLVPPELTVGEPPTAADPLAQLEEILSPHGLGLEASGAAFVVVRAAGAASAALAGIVRLRGALAPLAGVEVRIVELDRSTVTDAAGRFELVGLSPGRYLVEARRPGYVIDEPVATEVAAGARATLELLLQPAPFAGEEIVVEPSRISLLVDEPSSPLTLSRDEIAALPHLAGDVFRALDLLPGVVANDISAEIQVRGGRRDETLVLLDGQEVYDAYHLKDFDNALSVVASPTIDRLDLSTGSLPVSRGDRMGAALELTTLTPSEPGRHRLGISLLDLEVATAGRSHDSERRLGWLGSLRYGNSYLAGALFGEEDPSFWDFFGKGDIVLDERQSLRATALLSEDRLDFIEETNGEGRNFSTVYANQYLWVTHQAVLSERLWVDSAGSVVGFNRDRRGSESEPEKQFDVRDERDIRVQAVQQTWSYQPGRGGGWHAGFDARRYDADYDYQSHRDFDSPLAGLRAEPRDGDFVFAAKVLDEALGAWLSYRAKPLETLTLELGSRYDRHTGADDTIWSPRVALAWAAGESDVLRLAAGRHTQSQRAYELMVTDGDTQLYPVERARHLAAGYEHRFAGGASRVLSGVRLEIYEHIVSTPRPRYESMFEPFEPFVEGELDRYRVEPDRARSRGVELFLHGPQGRRLSWWLNYSLARAEDQIDGRWALRQIDQRHTFNADLTARLGANWSLNLAWRYHTGRPTTPISVVFESVPHDDDPGEEPETPDDGPEEAAFDASHELVPRPVLGALNSERLPDYHRLDLRLSRDWLFTGGRLTIFADVQNLYDRANVAGYDLEIDDESGELVKADEAWPGFLASAGISWQF